MHDLIIETPIDVCLLTSPAQIVSHGNGIGAHARARLHLQFHFHIDNAFAF